MPFSVREERLDSRYASADDDDPILCQEPIDKRDGIIREVRSRQVSELNCLHGGGHGGANNLLLSRGSEAFY